MRTAPFVVVAVCGLAFSPLCAAPAAKPDIQQDTEEYIGNEVDEILEYLEKDTYQSLSEEDRLNFDVLFERALSGKERAVSRAFNKRFRLIYKKYRSGEELSPGENQMLGVIWEKLDDKAAQARARVKAGGRPAKDGISHVHRGLRRTLRALLGIRRHDRREAAH